MSIRTHLGGVALAIAAEPRADAADKIGALALKQLTFHDAPSKAFRKGSGVARGDVYSEKLAAAVKAACEAVFAPFFNGVEIEASQYVPAPKDVSKTLLAQRDILRAAGVDEDKIRGLLPALYVEPAEAAELDEEAV